MRECGHVGMPQVIPLRIWHALDHCTGSCVAGTLFVLVKKESAVDSLLAAIRDKETDRIKALVKELSSKNPTTAPAKSDAIKGKWRLLWTEQASNANPLQKALSGQVRRLIYFAKYA